MDAILVVTAVGGVVALAGFIVFLAQRRCMLLLSSSAVNCGRSCPGTAKKPA